MLGKVCDEVVIVGIEVTNAACHFDLLFSGWVFSRRVRVEGGGVEAGHDFPAVKVALEAEVSAIERGGNVLHFVAVVTTALLSSIPVSYVSSGEEPFGLSVAEDDIPLVSFEQSW